MEKPKAVKPIPGPSLDREGRRRGRPLCPPWAAILVPKGDGHGMPCPYRGYAGGGFKPRPFLVRAL
jgi:hypothetical protein